MRARLALHVTTAEGATMKTHRETSRPRQRLGVSLPSSHRSQPVHVGAGLRFFQRGATAADATSMVFVFPGSSLTKVDLVDANHLAICCPGCGATKLVSLQPADLTVPGLFLHASDGCPIRRRIESALAKL